MLLASSMVPFPSGGGGSLGTITTASTGSPTTYFNASQAATMPTHSAGDLLLAFICEGNTSRVNTPSGYTQLFQITSPGTGTDVLTVFWKIAASGSETLTVTYSSSSDHSIFMMAVPGANGTTPIPNVGTESDATSTTSNTPGTVSCSIGDYGMACAIGDRNFGFSASPGTAVYEHNPADKSTAVNLYVAKEDETGSTTTSQTFSHNFGGSAAIAWNITP